MKRNALFLVGLFALLILFSCSKDKDPVNSFKFDGEEYLINDLYLIEEIFNEGAANEMHVFQFMFGNISGGDTTMLALAVLDENSNTLGGNYPSVGYDDEVERCLHPYALFFISGISFDGDSFYLAGDGGSVDVTIGSNGIYSVKFNNISVGTYETMGDNSTFEETGTVSGSYEGAIHKEVEEMGFDKSGVVHTRLNSLLQQVK
jgi:hypothetical protein